MEHPHADCVFSVPDSSNSAALGYSEESGIPPSWGSSAITTSAARSSILRRRPRLKVRIKYNAVREVIEGKRVIVCR